MQQKGYLKKDPVASRAVPAIVIDTDLANRQYENQAEQDNGDFDSNQQITSPDLDLDLKLPNQRGGVHNQGEDAEK